MFRVWVILAVLGMMILPLSTAAAAYVTIEGPCPKQERCWSFAANVWHVEGESEALNQGEPFVLDGKNDRILGTVDPDGQPAVLVVEIWDKKSHILRQQVVRATKQRPFLVSLQGLGIQPVHVFLYFRQGGQNGSVKGELHY
ncbi:hypothetical protein [Desmospora activa]|uniref:Uncharacterized protein n=1 Tax=Desmospora activa DSM 45169 TaxID=1121389 RepID=A0A2T4Z468_9BACL|nr:hypothetical protein [Desmospora activa]PTM56693.1 hypothetical protein C8J48_3018 [Desmospora activa DSM 45169]